MFNLNASACRRFIFSSLCLFIGSFSVHSQASSLLTMKAPDVMVTHIEFMRLVENDLFLHVTFKVKNTNPSHINSKAIRYEMLILGRRVANDYRDQHILLSANTISTVVLPVTLDVVRLWAVIPQALLLN